MPITVTATLDDGWLYSQIESVLGGLNTSRLEDLIEDDESPDLLNVFLERGKVRQDTGYTTFAGVVLGNPRASIRFQRTSGVIEQLLLTDATFYTFNSSLTAWELLSNGTSTTISVNEAGGQTVLSVTSETGFTVGAPIGIRLNDGTQHVTTVVSTAAGEITITTALPSASDAGKVVLEGADLSGDADIMPDWTPVPVNDWLVFTNGVDTPQRYDGSTVADVPGLIAAFTTFTAKTCTSWKNMLIFGNTAENGTAFPYRVRRSEIADPSVWTGTNPGKTDLLDTGDHVVAVRVLGPNLIVYREESIARGEYVGAADLLVDFNTVSEEEGLLGLRGVINLGEFHIFVGTRNVYRYEGGFDLKPIGGQVYFDIFAAVGFLNEAKRALVMAEYIDEGNMIMILLPNAAGDVEDCYMLFLDQGFGTDREAQVGAWTRRSFAPLKITGIGLYEEVNNLPWNQAQGTWAEQTAAWNSRSITATHRTLHLLDSVGKQAYNYDLVSGDDAGTEIVYRYVTKNYGLPDKPIRLDQFIAHMKGTSVVVSYSLDRGGTWNTIQTVSPGGTYTTVRMKRQVVGNNIMFRFAGTGGGFGLAWFGFMFRPESINPVV